MASVLSGAAWSAAWKSARPSPAPTAGRRCGRLAGAVRDAKVRTREMGVLGRGEAGARPSVRDGQRTLAPYCPLSPRPVVRAPGPAGGLRGALGRGRLHQLLLRSRRRELPEPALPAALLRARECRCLKRWDGWPLGTAPLGAPGKEEAGLPGRAVPEEATRWRSDPASSKPRSPGAFRAILRPPGGFAWGTAGSAACLTVSGAEARTRPPP